MKTNSKKNEDDLKNMKMTTKEMKMALKIKIKNGDDLKTMKMTSNEMKMT